jgi:hypothetical protein
VAGAATLEAGRRRTDIGGIGAAGLVLAGALVGLAIAADGALARAINGVGGLVWLASLGVLVWSVRRAPGRVVGAVAVLGVALALTFLVRPSELAPATVGFFVGGALVAAAVRRRELVWALLVPAAWLPVHLGVAVGRAVVRSLADGAPAVRTDPPPTAALVPLAMVTAAGVGGLAVRWVRERRANS